MRIAFTRLLLFKNIESNFFLYIETSVVIVVICMPSRYYPTPSIRLTGEWIFNHARVIAVATEQWVARRRNELEFGTAVDRDGATEGN